MNISTYESRIKALEDQLNPPAPGGSTGLLSVVLTPDITLSDGTSLNAKLAAMMPIVGEQKTIREASGTIGETYSVTVTPGSTWKAVAVPFNSEPVFGDVGKPLTVELQAGDSLTASFGAMATDIPEGSEPPADKTAIADIVVARK